MNKNELTPNLRVEYSASVNYLDGDGNICKGQHHFVGYVKKVYRKWFTDYALICECKSHRLDKVPVKDILGEVKNRSAKTGRFVKLGDN